MKTIRQKAEKLFRIVKPFAAPVVLAAAFIFLTATFIILRTGALTILRATLYYPFGLLLPGYLFARYTAGKDRSSELYAFSLFYGAGIAIACYFLDSYIHPAVLPEWFFCRFLGPVLSVPGLVLLLRDLKTGRRTRRSLIPDIRILAVAAVLVVLSLAIKAWLAAVPADSVETLGTPHIDVLWNTANMASLNRGWPADNIQYMGKLYKTNLFANVFRVAAHRFIGAKDEAEMMYVFSCLYLIPFLVFALDSLGRSFTGGDRRRAFLYVFAYLFVGYASRAVFFFYNLDWAYNIAYNNLWFGNSAINQVYAPNGSDLSIPGCAMLVLLLRKSCREGEERPGRLWPALLFASAIVTGAKYVSVVCVIGGLVGTGLVRLLQGKGWRNAAKTLIPLCVIAVGFVPVYYGVVSGAHIYEPATKTGAVYMTSDDPRYEAARDQIREQIDNPKYMYYLIRSTEGAPEPVVRQKSDGAYYIYGKDLSRLRRKNKALEGFFAQAENLRAEGILGGAGGTYELTEELNTFFRVEGANGFLRYTEGDTDTPCILLYGPETDMKIGMRDVAVVMKNPENTVTGMFVEGGNGSETEYEHIYSSVSINASMQSSKLYNTIFAGTGMKDSPWMPLVLFLLIPVHFIMARPLTAVPFFCWMGERLKRFRSIREEDLIAGGTAVCGLLAFYLLSIDGNSQRYFLDTAILFTDAAGACWICEHYRGLSRHARRWLCYALILGLCTNGALDLSRARDGVRKVRSMRPAEQVAALTEAALPGNYITRYEMEAMDWLRANTPLNAVVATNRHYQFNRTPRYQQPQPNDYASRFYYYAAYGERQVFLGSWAYLPRTQSMQEMLRERLVVNDALFNPMCVNKREIMEAHGISYLIASNEARSGMNLQEEDLVCLFKNRDVAIYGLSGNEAGTGEAP